MKSIHYYILEFPNNHTDTICKTEITEREYDELLLFHSPIEDFRKIKSHYQMLKGNANEIIDYCKELNKIPSNGLSPCKINDYTDELNRKFNNYLASLKIFTDKTQHYSQKLSDNLTTVTLLMNNFYDIHNEYWLLYKLRNYTQHSQSNIASISAWYSENLMPCLQRDILLRNNAWNKSQKEFIKSLPDKIPLAELIEKNQHHIENIYKKYLSQLFPDMKKVLLHLNVIDNKYGYKIPKVAKEIRLDDVPTTMLVIDLGMELLSEILDEQESCGININRPI